MIGEKKTSKTKKPTHLAFKCNIKISDILNVASMHIVYTFIDYQMAKHLCYWIDLFFCCFISISIENC